MTRLYTVAQLIIRLGEEEEEGPLSFSSVPEIPPSADNYKAKQSFSLSDKFASSFSPREKKKICGSCWVYDGEKKICPSD